MEPPASDFAGPRGAREQAPTCDLAIYSLVCGVVGLFCLSIFAAVPGVVLGHMALKKIRNSGGRLEGHGLAVAGLILNYINILLFVFSIVIIVLALAFMPPMAVSEGPIPVP
jgi:uncharacterized membrane protein